MRNKEIVYLLSFLPFLAWGFMGGHKQPIFGINSDYIFIALAFLGAFVAWADKFRFNVDFARFCFFIFSLLIVYLASFLSGYEYYNVKAFFIHFVYIFIFLSAALFFSDKIELLVSSVVVCSFISSLVLIVSWFFLGFSSWGRVTIPSYIGEMGGFFYYPYGYESSPDVNVVSYFIYSGLIISYWLWFPKWAILKIAYSLVVLMAGLLTMSRSGALGLLSVALFVFFYEALVSIDRNYIKKKHINFFLFGVLSFPLIVFLFYEIGFLEQALIRVTEGAVESNQDRLNRLNMAINIISKSGVQEFLLGNGIGFSRFQFLDPHNFYLSTHMDVGFFGVLLTFLVLLVPVSMSFFQSGSGNNILKCVISVFVFFSVVALFYWQLRFYYFVVFIIIVLYLNMRMRHSEDNNLNPQVDRIYS